MKANELRLIDFLSRQGTQFVIPVYQRNYDWTLKQCAKLLDDILAIAQENEGDTHFLGSIVFIQGGVYTTSDLMQLNIIDGQQRLTTIILLWLALHHKAKELGKERLADEIQDMYLINRYLEDDARIKLKPTENNAIALKKLLNKEVDFERMEEDSSINRNFKYFYRRINEINLTQIKKGISRLIFVEISLEKGKDEPQKIFESLNSTGLALSQADLIRNYILMNLDYKLQERIYQDYWLPIEELTYNDETLENELSDFIRHFLSFKHRDVPRKSKVYETFKRKYSTENYKSLEDLLKDLKTYAGYYNFLINPEKETNKQIKEQIKLINNLEIGVSYPFLLEVYHDYYTKKISLATFIEVLTLIQSFVWRRFICNVPTNALNKIFLRLYDSIENTETYIEDLQRRLIRYTGTQRFPNDAEVEKELEYKDVYNIQSKNRKYLLSRLENHDNNEPVQIEGNEQITIEHIFPQNPSPEWLNRLSEKDYKDFKEKYLNTLANLTLSGNNGALGNKTFEQKRDLPGKGYKDSRLFLNKFLSEEYEWNVKILKKRFEILLGRFKQIWRYPENIVIEEPENEMNIFEVDDPTGKNLEYYSFYGRKENVNTFREMFRNIAKQLYEFDEESFLQDKIVNRLRVTQDRNILNQPLELGNDYFIEGSLSSKDIFKRIRLLLEIFGLEDQLLVKFKDQPIKEDTSSIFG